MASRCLVSKIVSILPEVDTMPRVNLTRQVKTDGQNRSGLAWARVSGHDSEILRAFYGDAAATRRFAAAFLAGCRRVRITSVPRCSTRLVRLLLRNDRKVGGRSRWHNNVGVNTNRCRQGRSARNSVDSGI